MKNIRSAVFLVLALTLIAPAFGADSITMTTLSTAVTSASATTIQVASATGFTAGSTYAFVDRELMAVRAVSGTTISVVRGYSGTAATLHRSGAEVYVGPVAVFISHNKSGSCNSRNERILPQINPKTGLLFECVSSGRVRATSTGVWAAFDNSDAGFSETLTAEDVSVSGRLFVRDSFDQGYYVLQNDLTAKSVADAEVNVVLGSPLGLITYREELAKTASSWVLDAGRLDISADDTTDNEGVEIVFGGDGTDTTGGVIVAGSSGACFAAKVSIALIAGTDQVQIGWRDNATFVDGAVYSGYTVWNTVGVNNVDGSIMSSQEVSEATDTDDSGVNWADGDARILRVCISPAGVPSAFYSDNNSEAMHAITMKETGSTLTAGTKLYPFLSYLQAGGAVDANVRVHWVELSPAPK